MKLLRILPLFALPLLFVGCRTISTSQLPTEITETNEHTFEAACFNGNARACSKVGDYFKNKNNDSNAENFYEKACKLGDGRGCYEKGFKAYELFKVYPIALEYYKKGCELRNGYACERAGWFYQKGLGVAPSKEESRKYYQAAMKAYYGGCSWGNGSDCDAMGVAHANGEITYKSAVRALEYYEKGCALKHALACYHAGEVYQEGKGVPKSLDKAKEYYTLSCELGDRWGLARHKLEELNKTK